MGFGGLGGAKVFYNDEGVEVCAGEREDFEIFGAECGEGFGCEVIDVLGKDVAVAGAEEAGGEGAEVWDEDEAVAAGF